MGAPKNVTVASAAKGPTVGRYNEWKDSFVRVVRRCGYVVVALVDSVVTGA